ncbi:FG-GAP repeat domain-containing protein [Algoriphagus antarcticus]|uniref:VCBS repeat protein n=1 Tax=Algoriphagus antarcticus TaxID=238540 RepID=A0A3E0E3R5_9BACT|nr:VCBS repeat-containing protein [Algoriphagus antarcticus]REG92878.1 VCBS repeat protein [Algoriphagus antarcticus]
MDSSYLALAKRLFCLLILAGLSFHCQSPMSTEPLLSQDEQLLHARRLAELKCGSCHLFPEPNLLDKKTWSSSVLPAMKSFVLNSEVQKGFFEKILSKNTLPKSELEYQQIVEYYSHEAPEMLPKMAVDLPISGIPGFQLIEPDFRINRSTLTTFVQWDSISGHLWVGDRLNQIFELDPNDFSILSKIETSSTPVQVQPLSLTNLEILTMGKMDPADLYQGQLLNYSKESKSFEVIIDSLNRPVNMIRLPASISEKDIANKFIISSFGNSMGSLDIFSNAKKTTLRSAPGARRAIAVDWDNDGLMDVIAGFGQALEGVFWFKNFGDGKFETIPLLEFHPLYRLSDLSVQDINQDGFEDLIVSNGDNADLSPILKPYHGIRIYYGDGSRELTEGWFYPMPGAMSIISADFDQDGFIEIAAVSYFPDFSQEERLDWLYFDKVEDSKPEVFQLPQSIRGNWLTLSHGDFDRDGDLDIFTSSFVFQSGTPDPNTDYEYSIPWQPFFILENKLNY